MTKGKRLEAWVSRKPRCGITKCKSSNYDMIHEFKINTLELNEKILFSRKTEIIKKKHKEIS